MTVSKNITIYPHLGLSSTETVGVSGEGTKCGSYRSRQSVHRSHPRNLSSCNSMKVNMCHMTEEFVQHKAKGVTGR